jgi:hypothetical protein
MLNGISNFEWKRLENWSMASSSCSLAQSGIQTLAKVYAKTVEKNTIRPL